jgi:hypothetical protein
VPFSLTNETTFCGPLTLAPIFLCVGAASFTRGALDSKKTKGYRVPD